MRDITLRCVECGHAGLDGRTCPSCGKTYPAHGRIPILIGGSSRLDAAAIAARPAPAAVDLERSLRHWETSELKAWLTAERPAKLLSHGCGDGGDRAWLESLGHDVTAFDIYPSPATDVIADGHDLPFVDGAFDLVTSIAVLQDLPDPLRATAEIGRVLRRGGTLIGSVAFLEPFTGNDYFHMSHLGVREALSRAGLRDVEIAPGWSWLEAISGNFWVFARLPAGRLLTQRLSRAQYRAGVELWRGYYRLRGKRPPDELPLHFAASLLFRARK